ncbi:hypothetical protein DL771_010471 [Monosporascus sp. 5C6A]|nr:hypothetical protein DL771_010471 [Monosporascus sp. 5C6A]
MGSLPKQTEANMDQSQTPKQEATIGPPRDAQKAAVDAKFPWLKEITGKHRGLKILNKHEEMDEIEVDIVAVHGIGVHPEDAWNHRKTKRNWLADKSMLPADFPNARIMAYGYASYWFGDQAVKQSVETVATDLLDCLGEKRADCLHRPIIFVGHCFGGLVIQKAYTRAMLLKDDYLGISDSVTGMLFLGTPHHGVKENSQFQTEGQIYQAIAETNTQVEDNVLKTLAQDNEMLVSVHYDFTRTVCKHGNCGPKIFCFFEQQKSKVGRIAGLENVSPEFVVGESSGTLSGHRKGGLPLDHFAMNKFEDEEDANYASVRREIRIMKNESKAIIDGRGLAAERPPAPLPSTTKRNHLRSLPAPIAREPHFAQRGGILDRIETEFKETPIVVLSGDSGNGKTHIAVEYAHKLHIERPGFTVYWVNAASAAQFELSYKRIAKILHLDMKRLGDGNVVEAVFDTLRRDASGYWLMVLDGLDDDTSLNATEPSITGRSLLDFVPKAPLARVLATTRSEPLAMRMVNHKTRYIIDVPKLNDDDASFLLLGKHTSDKMTKELALAVAKTLGRCAGPLTMAYMYRQSAKVTLKNYMDEVAPPNSPVKPDQGTMRAWRLLYKAIQKTEDANLLRLIGSLEVQSIPGCFFERSQFSEELPRLVRSGMVEPSADGRVFTVTPIVRKCVQKRLTKTREKESVEAQALFIMCGKFDKFAEKDQDISELLPCALAVLKFRPTSAEGKRHLATLENRVGNYYAHLGYHLLAQKHLERCLRLLKKDPDKKGDLVGETRRGIERVKGQLDLSKSKSETPVNTGTTARQKNEAERELEKLEKPDGQDQTDIVRKVSDFATSQLAQGDEKASKAAVALYQRVLDWCKKNYGEDNIDTGRRQYNLALAYDEVGEYDKAAALYQSAAQIVEQHLGPGHPELLKILGALACMYCRQGRLDEAQKAFNVVLVGQQKVLGSDHPDTLVTRQNVAMMLESMGQVSDAGDELEEVLSVQVRLLGCDDPATLRTSCSLAMNYRLRGLLENAEKLFTATLESQKRLLGENHRDTAMTKSMQMEFLGRTGKLTT